MKFVFTILLSLLSFFNQKDDPLKVYVFLAEECPISIHMTYPLGKVSASFNEGFEYFAVFPKTNSTEETATTFLKEHHMENFQIILDPEQEMTKSLGGTVTPEAVVVKGDDILYRGRINDDYSAPGRRRHAAKSSDLNDALEHISNGKQIDQPWPKAIGCFITFVHK